MKRSIITSTGLLAPLDYLPNSMNLPNAIDNIGSLSPDSAESKSRMMTVLTFTLRSQSGEWLNIWLCSAPLTVAFSGGIRCMHTVDWCSGLWMECETNALHFSPSSHFTVARSAIQR